MQYVAHNKFTFTQTLLHNKLLISQKYANAMRNGNEFSSCWRPINGTPRTSAVTCTNVTKIGISMVQTCSIDVSGLKYSHFKCIYWHNYMKNCLLVAIPVLRCQFQNSSLAMIYESNKSWISLIKLNIFSN